MCLSTLVSPLAIHIYYLTGLRNRLMVLGNWIYSYFTYDFAVRVIHQRHQFPYPEEVPMQVQEKDLLQT